MAAVCCRCGSCSSTSKVWGSVALQISISSQIERAAAVAWIASRSQGCSQQFALEGLRALLLCTLQLLQQAGESGSCVHFSGLCPIAQVTEQPGENTKVTAMK